MSDVPEGEGWWQAADGKWYPPTSPPGYVAPGSAPGAGPGAGSFPGAAVPPTNPQYVAPGYGTPPPGWTPPPGHGVPYSPGAPKTNSFAVAALVCGIASIPMTICCLGIILGPVAIYLGVRAKEEIRASGGTETGEGMATAGLVTGIIGGVMSVLWLFLSFAGG